MSHHIESHQLEKVCSIKVGFPLPSLSLSLSLFFLPSPLVLLLLVFLPFSVAHFLSSIHVGICCRPEIIFLCIFLSPSLSFSLSISLSLFYLFCMMFVTLRAASIDGTVSDLKEASLGFLYPKTTKISLEFLIFSTLSLAPGGLRSPGRFSHSDTD